MKQGFYIGENDFRVWLPELSWDFSKSEGDQYNSRKINGIMSTQRVDRQGEDVIAKGLDFQDFLANGHFNDNHSQATSAIVGYPEEVKYYTDLSPINPNLAGIEGWTCKGYILKGTERANGIWELAKSLMNVPNKKLGFSIEGKVVRRANKTIEKARIRNVAITNCPVNTDATWNCLAKSFYQDEETIKAMSAGFATSPAAQSGGGALRSESLDSDAKELFKKKKKAIEKALGMESLVKAIDYVLEENPAFDVDAAAILVTHLYKNGGVL